ncbi:MAG: hypothetical protein ABIT38_20915, partial [Gemmatimonadaceae bacterium]
MSLIDRLSGRKTASGGMKAVRTGPSSDGIDAPAAAAVVEEAPVVPTFTRGAPQAEELSAVDKLKVDIHHRLISRLDLEALEAVKDEAEVTAQIRLAVAEFLRNEPTPLSQAERDEIVEHIVWEITGLGPIEPLFRDPTITDILVNNARDIFVERKGRLYRVDTQFRNDAHL